MSEETKDSSPTAKDEGARTPAPPASEGSVAQSQDSSSAKPAEEPSRSSPIKWIVILVLLGFLGLQGYQYLNRKAPEENASPPIASSSVTAESGAPGSSPSAASAVSSAAPSTQASASTGSSVAASPPPAVALPASGPLAGGNVDKPTQALRVAGYALYKKQGCAACHGEQGEGTSKGAVLANKYLSHDPAFVQGALNKLKTKQHDLSKWTPHDQLAITTFLRYMR